MKTKPTAAFTSPSLSLPSSTSAKKAATGRSGFTLHEIMLVVALVGLLATIAIPNFMAARTSSQVNLCMNNMRKIEDAKEQWAMENSASNGTLVSWEELLRYFKTEPVCPGGGVYYQLEVGQAVYCTNHDWRVQYTGEQLACAGLEGFHP